MAFVLAEGLGCSHGVVGGVRNGNGNGNGGATGVTGGTTGSTTTGGGPGGAPPPPPPRIVGNCNGLAAVDQLQDITPPTVNRAMEFGILSVVADPMRTGTILAGTGKQGLWQSTDCGSTWKKINTGAMGDVLDSGLLWELQIDPVNPNIVYTGSLYGKDVSLLRSTNGGVDWQSMMPVGSAVEKTVEYNFFQEMSFEPGNPRHIVVSFHALCMGAYAPMCLAESKDSGSTWRLFKGPSNGWVENARPLVFGPTSWAFGTWQDGLFFTGNSGATWEKVLDGGNVRYRRADGTFFLGAYTGIYRGTDGRSWTKIAGAPGFIGSLLGDGQRMFASGYLCCDDKLPFAWAPEATGEVWKKIPSAQFEHGASKLAYDPDHHVMFAAMTEGGLWRFRTR